MTSGADLKDTLSYFLTKPWTRTNTPRGFADVLQNAALGAATETQQLFFDAGHKCLLAYHLATTERTSHKAGPSTGVKRRQTIDNLSIEHRRALATHLQRTRCHPSVTAAIHKFSERLQAQLKKKTEATSQATQASHSRLSSSLCDMNDSASMPSSSEAQVQEQQRQPNGIAVADQLVEGCLPDLLHQVFEPLLAEAIRHRSGMALVSMIFPLQQDKEARCSMRIVLAQNKVTMIVKELFGDWLECDEVSRRQYIRLDNGRRHHPLPTLRLDGPSKVAMNAVLGQRIVSAVEENPRRRLESTMYTSCVSMEIGAEPADCLLEIDMGLTQGMDIHKLLHPIYSAWEDDWQGNLSLL